MNARQRIDKLKADLFKNITEAKNLMVKMASEMATVNTADGITLYIDGELVEGTGVYNEDGTPVQDGDYTLADTTTITVVEGKIAQVVSPAPTDETAPETEMADDKSNDISELKAEIELLKSEMAENKLTIENLAQYLEEYAKHNNNLTNEKKELEAKVEKLSNEPAGQPVIVAPVVLSDAKADRIKRIKSLARKQAQ